MRMNISLRTRLIFSMIFLLAAQAVFILYVIERREIKAINEEQKEKAVLLAQLIAQENLQAFVMWDVDGVKESIENRIDENLRYVIFYDLYNRTFVNNDFIADYEDIYQYSNLPLDVKEGDYAFQYTYVVDPEDPEHEAKVRILEIEVPIYIQGNALRWGSIKIGLSLKEIEEEIYHTRNLLLLMGLGGLFLGILAATWIASRITNPIKKLVDGTHKISRGDFSLKIDIDSRDEIGNLASSFNEMSYQLMLLTKRMEEANKKLIQVEKLASIGHMSTGIAHEIRNPLTSVKLNIQKLLEKTTLDELDKAHLDISREGIAQIEKFIKELLDFARISDLNLDSFSLEQIMDGSIKMMADTLELKHITLETHYENNLPLVQVDADKLRQVFLNILHNACEAVNEGGKIDVHLSTVFEDSGSKVKVEIADNGAGIPEEEWSNIFEPFYTTKASGIGLGLAIALKIIEQHNGIIKVKSKQDLGTTFEILIPCEEEK